MMEIERAADLREAKLIDSLNSFFVQLTAND